MTLAPPIFRNFHATPALAGWLLFATSIVVTLGVFSANLASLDGIIMTVGVLPCSLALLMIAEAERDRPGGRRAAGLATAAAGLALVGWSSYAPWVYAGNFPGHEARYLAVESLPFVATGLLLIMAGLAWARLMSEKGVLIAGTGAGVALTVASIVTALAFATADSSEGEEAKTFLATLTAPLAFSVFVTVSALRHGGGLRRLPYLPLAGFVLIVSIAISSAIWSAGTEEHIMMDELMGTAGTLPSTPDVTVNERLYAFYRLAMFPVVLGTLVLLSGPYRRGAGAVATVALLLAAGFAGWSAADPSRVPVPDFSGWTGIGFISSPFWIFAGVLITPFAVYMLAMSRAKASDLSFRT